MTDQMGVLPDLPLRVIVHAKEQKPEQVKEVHLPIGFRVRGKGQVLAGLFPGDSRLDPFFIAAPRGLLKLLFLLR